MGASLVVVEVDDVVDDAFASHGSLCADGVVVFVPVAFFGVVLVLLVEWF